MIDNQHLTSFSGHLKSADLSSMPLDSRRSLEIAFPGFFLNTAWSATESALRQPDPTTRQSPRRRRFSGCTCSAKPLPPNRYFSLSNENGTDNEVLGKELVAYTDPKIHGRAFIFDLSDNEAALAMNDGKTEYTLKVLYIPQTLVKSRRNPFTRIIDRFRSPKGNGVALFSIPYRVETVSLHRVVDLRLPRVRAWFYDRYKKGDNIFFRKSPHSDLGRNDFFDMWPTLCSPQLGGNLITDAIGASLRSIGVNALIYPSARANHCVHVEGGDLVNWVGWNLVDYRDQTFDRADCSTPMIVDNNNWSGKHLPHVRLDFDSHQNNGDSFSVSNLEQSAEIVRNLEVSNGKLSLESWGFEIESYRHLNGAMVFPKSEREIKL